MLVWIVYSFERRIDALEADADEHDERLTELERQMAGLQERAHWTG